MPKTWDELKQMGSAHYKTADVVEPIDLFDAGDLLWPKAISDIIKYAFRNRKEGTFGVTRVDQDMDKIIHYAEIVKHLAHRRDGMKPADLNPLPEATLTEWTPKSWRPEKSVSEMIKDTFKEED